MATAATRARFHTVQLNLNTFNTFMYVFSEIQIDKQ